jgi:Zn-dependent peptidase ImmA (M78 family)
MTPNWPLSTGEARWVAEQQAALLLAEARITAPPVPERIVRDLAGVHVYELDILPVPGLLSASKPSGRGGDIVIDSTLPPPERRVTLLHELKHIIDGSQTSGEELCTDFALNVLMPAPWLQADWQTGQRNVGALAARYQVPTEAVEDRLHALGLQNRTRRPRRRSYCQWQPHIKNTKARRIPQ